MEKPLTREDLPDWMRQHQSRFDYPLLALWLICGAVALPLLIRQGLPNSLAAQAEIARFWVMAENFQSAIFYPRWASHFHYGYGSPLLNYLAPAPHYLGGLHLLFAQTSPTISLKFWLALSIVLAGTGMFLWVRDLWGNLAGLAAALVYLLSPALVYRLVYVEVNLGVMLAAAIFPYTLWAIDRLIEYLHPRYLIWLSLSLAILLLCANWMGLILLALLMCYAGYQLYILHSSFQTTQALLLGIGLGVGLASFYWLPVLFEWDEVIWQPLDTHLRPLSLAETLRFPAYPNAEHFNTHPTGELGFATWGLFILGSLLLCWEYWRYQKTDPLRRLAFWVFASPLMLALATQFESPWLDNASQFPAMSRLDLLIPVIVGGAVMAGQVARALQDYIPQLIPRNASAVLLMGLIVGSAAPILNPPAFVQVNVSDHMSHYLQSELRGTLIGSLWTGVFLPNTVRQMPLPSFALVDSYLADQVVKVERASRLPNSNLGILEHTPNQDRFRINQAEASRLELLTFNFLGWRASFQNQAIPLGSTERSGLIELDLPSGEGILTVRFGSSRARALGWGLSGLSLLALLAYLRLKPRPKSASIPTNKRLKSQLSVSFITIGLILLGREVRPAAQVSVTPAPHFFEGGVDFLGFSAPDTLAAPNDVLQIDLLWQAARPNLPDYQVRLVLVESSSRNPIASVEHRLVGGWQTSYWRQNRQVLDVYYLKIPPWTSLGVYELEIQVLRCDTRDLPYNCLAFTPLRAFDPRGTPEGDRIVLPTQIRVQ